MKKKKVAIKQYGDVLTVGTVDGKVRERKVEYEEHYLQQLRRERDSAAWRNKSPSLDADF